MSGNQRLYLSVVCSPSECSVMHSDVITYVTVSKRADSAEQVYYCSFPRPFFFQLVG